jgi:hypothetical protein
LQSLSFQGFVAPTATGAGIESSALMTTFFRRLKLDSEPPARREFTIAIVTLYAIVVTILAGELVERMHADETETKSTYGRLRTQDV